MALITSVCVPFRYGNPTDLGADVPSAGGGAGVTAEIVHDVEAPTLYLTASNLTHRYGLFPGLAGPPVHASYRATATLLPWDESWTLLRFAQFPMETPSMVEMLGAVDHWFFEDSYPVPPPQTKSLTHTHANRP